MWHKLYEESTQSIRVQLKFPFSYKVLWYCVKTHVGKHTRNYKNTNKFKQASTSVAKCIPYYEKY